MKSCHHNSTNGSQQAIEALTREARRLHKSALSSSKMKALPVLRRLITAKVFSQLSLVELYQQQHRIQRKHLLNLLAKEVGYGQWSLLKNALSHSEVTTDLHPSLELKGAGYPNIWFSTADEAYEYVVSKGGKAIQVGEQAVVIPIT